MYLQITTRCNMHCEHCSMAAGPRGRDMSLETFRAALRHANGDSISLGGGEPTIHPLFWQFLGEALAVTADANGPWLATNGAQTETALALANLARYGVIGCALSQDAYHDPIDDRVVEAFTREKKPRSYGDTRAPDCREIRDVTGREIKAGRCKFGESGCICEDLIVKPDGTVRACGCARAPKFGNVNDVVTVPDDWEYGTCYRRQPGKE